MTILLVISALLNVAGGQTAAASAPPTRSDWIALAKGGFAVPTGRTALAMLQEMNVLLASDDPVLRDEVAYGAAERWILRDHRLSPADLRVMLRTWTGNLDEGLGATGDGGVFKRSFSALCLSVIAAAELSTPFLEQTEVQAFFDRMLDYFQRERDLRGFDSAHGWMHTVAHTSDTLKFLMRNPKLAAGSGGRLLAAVRTKIEASGAVFVWGENDRMALALQSAVRRQDADAAVLTDWTQFWVNAHRTLWANGPQIDPRRFSSVENAAQVMRSLAAALAMETAPTANGEAARQAVVSALAKMR